MNSLNVFTVPQSTPGAAWGWPSVNASSNAPAAGSGSNPEPAADRRFTLRSRSEANRDSGRNSVTIVLVEDNPADVRLVQIALEEHDIAGELLVFADGAEAIQFIEKIESGSGRCPDMMILDLNLPKRPGREVLQCRDRSGKLRNIPVVVLSSSDAAQDRDEAARLGADLYLRKPSHLDEYLRIGATLRELLRLPPN